MTRSLVFASALFGAACLAACASSEKQESVQAAARAACEAQKDTIGADMSACVAQMEETIRAARAYHRPSPQHRSQSQHG